MLTALQSFTPTADLLANRVILITGAANGIGRAIAKGAGAVGATVICLDKDLKGLESLYDELVQSNAPEPALYPLDLAGATGQHYVELAQTLQKEFGKLDGLLHNAAFLGAITPFQQLEFNLWQKVLQTNVNGPMQLTQQLLPLLVKSDSPRILFTSDTVGRKAKAYWGAYAVSKFAIEGLMQTLAHEYDQSPKIFICSLDPGPVHSYFRMQCYPGESAQARRQPEALVNAYLYLLSTNDIALQGKALTL